MVNSSEHGVSRVVHHKDYYLRGGDMTVLVENHLYRIHSYFFDRESLFFRQKLLAGPAGDGEERPSNDSEAYTLEDVKSEDFARFLWVFYNPKYSMYEAPLETWLSILRLATRWGFNSVKELTVRELEKLEIESIEKIAIYHEYSISKLYLIPSYISVVKRDKPLSFTEGMKLGMETVLRVADARERVRQHASESGIRTPSFDDFEDSEVERLVREIFNLGSRPTSPTPPAGPTPIPNGPPAFSIKLNAPPKTNGAASRTNGINGEANGTGDAAKLNTGSPATNGNNNANANKGTGNAIHNVDREISPTSATAGRGQEGQRSGGGRGR
ncbi:hypothetical protein SCLCIDRAFT_1028542 [Scleroderma citrinum Foug A]|uniref:BTB domain-containing protein n=1 Tax=Scleroderma citrinum Foug A TaxID=1036808 RepID=A0A0C3DTP3_9AGAM|nr:hypothetical protein SCLCIDRAFT_1028542 [Scleroderma citrinum Foug A]